MVDLPSRIVVTPASTFTHEFEIEDRVRRATRQDTLRGIFFTRTVEAAKAAGVRLDKVQLEHRPKDFRYQAFLEYPVADYFRLVAAAASAIYPHAPISEGMRRIASDDFDQLASTKPGRVMLAFAGDVKTSLLKAGNMYGTVLKGQASVEASYEPDGRVRISYRDYPGPTEAYPAGTIESACRHYDADYEIDIHIHSPESADYFVSV